VTQQEILDFINKFQGCSLATCDGDKPHVRGMLTYRADEKGIVFHTGIVKDLFRQLHANPNVELTFNNGDSQNLTQVRVRGVAMLDGDADLKEEIISNRPFLQPIVAQHGREAIAVFRVQNLEATVWTWATNLTPDEWVKLG
jgi:pyridoxamine 5'-phosphate oxidase